FAAEGSWPISQTGRFQLSSPQPSISERTTSELTDVVVLAIASPHPREMNGRPGPSAAGVAKREDSYGRIGGPKAGSRASSPGEQAAACDYIRTRELGRGASRSLRLPKKLVSWAARDNVKKLVR